jgi:uncharacterized protein YndB with AHSA1/START domain
MSVRTRRWSVRTAVALSVLCLTPSVPASAQDVTPVVTEGFVGASVNAVWDAWTTLAGIKAWLTPKADIDLKVGGLIRTNYRENEVLGDAGTIVYTIRDFEPRRMLAYQITGPPQNWQFPNAVKQLTVVIYFEPVEPQVTTLRIVSMGFGADEESQRMRAFFADGDAITLERMQLHFQALRQSGR